MNVPRVLLLVLALLQAGGIIDLVRRETCEAECDRNGCTDCTPGADACSCHCPSTATVTAPDVAAVTLARIGETISISFDRSDRRHLSPDPREILHVPRHRVV
ncbi:MAG TPA: hypothetical protein VGC41_04640 [Kofleriaceae bacterium]